MRVHATFFKVNGKFCQVRCPSLVQDFGHLAIAVLVEQAVDLGDDLRFGFANLGDRHRAFDRESPRGTAAQSAHAR